MRIEERLKDSVARYGARPAVFAQRIRHSYAELEVKAQRLAAALQGGGLRRGDRVAIFMDDGWEALVSTFAVLMAGGVVVPVGADTAGSVFAETLQKRQPVAVITQSRLAAMVATAISSVFSIRLVVLAGGGRADAGSTCISFEETVGRIGRAPPLSADGDDSDPAVQFGGDEPLTHGQLADAADAAAIPEDGMALPPLSEPDGFGRMLAALAAGRTMMAGAPFAREGCGERRNAAPRPSESAFGVSRLFDGAIADAAPVLQR